jgi:transcription initiation factor TFIID subunit 11
MKTKKVYQFFLISHMENSTVFIYFNFLVPMNVEDNEIEGNFVDHERVSLISQFFNEKQMNRYAKFKESSLENRRKIRSTQKIECPRIKRVIQQILGEQVQISSTIQIAMHGIAKIYAGELVEEAKEILVEEEGERKEKFPPIKTRHLREARRRMIQRGILPNFKPKTAFSKK